MKAVFTLLLLLPCFFSNAQTWSRITDLPDASGILTSCPGAPNILIYNNTLRSTDYGRNWETIDATPFTKPQFLTWHTTMKRTAFFRAFEGNTPVVLQSDDAGVTFKKTTFPAVHRLYIGTDPQYMLGVTVVRDNTSEPSIHRIWRSVDEGAVWFDHTTSFRQHIKRSGTEIQCTPNYREARFFTLDPQAPTRVRQYIENDFCAADCLHYEWLLASTSFGDSASFQLLPSWQFGELKTGWLLHLFEHNPAQSSEMIVCGTQYLRITLDDGSTWLDSDFRSSQRTAADLDLSSGLLLTGGNDGVSSSTSHGRTWSTYNDGLLSLKVRAIHHAPDGQWYAATNEGLYELVASLTSTEGLSADGFVLEQNAPNPFSSSTTIRFSIPPESVGLYARVSVHDVLGREVATLFVGRATASSIPLVFTPGDIPSGVYHVRLTSGGQTTHRAMMYLGK